METPEWNMNHPKASGSGEVEPTGGTEDVGRLEAAVEAGPSRGTRNQKACDGCRSRKVKCFSSPGGDRCQGCVFLDIACTQHLPRRKRGPPNRTQIRAAAAAGRLQGPVISPPSDTTTTFGQGHGASPGQGASPIHQRHLSFPGSMPAPLSHVDGHGGGLSPSLPPPTPAPASLLDAFAPRVTITRILDAWFNDVHALAPVLCRRHFLRRIAAGQADSDPIFCGLVVSVCAATVATLRRESFGHMTIEICLDFIERNRLLQPGLSKQIYTLDWCIAMYNLGTAMMALPNTEEAKMSSFNAMSQAAAGVRYLAYYLIGQMGKMEQEQVKRLFWLIFVGSVSSDCQGDLAAGFITHQENLQHLQLEMLTDAELDRDVSMPVQMLSPEAPSACSPASERSSSSSTFSNWDNICYVAGLDSLRRLYCVWHDSQTVSPAMLGGPGPALQHYQERIQQIVDSLPRELRWRGGLSRPSYVTQGHESQTVNLFVSSLHIRSNLLQKRAEHTPTTAAEHQRIIDDLLEILYHLPPPVFYANGLSLMPKIRDIGAAYLEEMEASSERTPEVQDRMARLSSKLSDLDCWPEVPRISELIRESSCSVSVSVVQT